MVLVLGCDAADLPDAGSMDAAPASDGGRDAGMDGGDPSEDGGPGDPDAQVEGDAGMDGGGPHDAGLDPSAIPAPRPIEPASTVLTTAPTVRFRWALVPPATGARVEVCRGRAGAYSRPRGSNSAVRGS